MIGFLGGTGPEGRGLALRFALAGEDVIIGSRDAARAEEAANQVAALAPGAIVEPALNPGAAERSDIVFIALPYGAQRPVLEALAQHLGGKIVVDTASPLRFRKGAASIIPVRQGSAALEAQAILPDSKIAAAFQTVSAHDLLDPNKVVASDVIVCSDDEEGRRQVMSLSEKIEGVRAIDGGGLANAGYVEGITALLLNLNRRYKARTAIKIVGI